MAECKSIVKHYQNHDGLHLEMLWNRVYKKGARVETLRDILMFYLHHKLAPPIMQKSYDTLLSTYFMKGTSKKAKMLLFQIIEESCAGLEGSLIEKLTLSANTAIPIELLNCILISGLIPLLDENTVDKLFSLLRCSDISTDERGKLLLFLCEVYKVHPSIISKEGLNRLSILMGEWFRYIPSLSLASNRRSEKNIAVEVDGSVAGQIYTVLTLANNFSDTHVMGIHLFATVREWLDKKILDQNQLFADCLKEYCSFVVEQSLRPTQKDHDATLQKAVLCEVLDILTYLVQLDQSQASQCLLIVKRIQTNVIEKFKADYRDICILVRVLTFLLKFGEMTGYNAQSFCEQFLGDIVHRSYASGLAAFDITIFLVENKHMMLSVEQPLLQHFFPNLLKIIAFHPSVFIEEFIDLIPAFTSPATAVELFHSLIDLPVLSATLCLHQGPVLLQKENAGSLDDKWLTVLTNIRLPEFRPIFDYIMRFKSNQKDMTKRMPDYMKLLNDLRAYNLVITCSQIVPLLLDSYFSTVASWDHIESVIPVVKAMLKRLLSIYDVPGYMEVIRRSISEYMKKLFNLHPQLVVSIQNELTDFLSSLKNSEICLQLFIYFIWAVGEYSSSSRSQCSQEHILKYYETIECLVYEILSYIQTNQVLSLQLINVACAALAKLCSKCQDLISRTALSLNKVKMQVSSGLLDVPSEEKQIVLDRVEELLCLLRNPNMSAVIWSGANNTPSMMAVVQILAHFTDS